MYFVATCTARFASFAMMHERLQPTRIGLLRAPCDRGVARSNCAPLHRAGSNRALLPRARSHSQLPIYAAGSGPIPRTWMMCAAAAVRKAFWAAGS